MVRFASRFFCLLLVLVISVQRADAERAHRTTTKSLLSTYQALAERSDLTAMEKFTFAAHLLKNSLPNSNSLSKAITLLHSASDEGEVRALYLLSELYQGGVHVNRDSERAEQFLAEAVKRDAGAGRAPEIPLGLFSCAEMLKNEGLASSAVRLPDAAAYTIGWCLLTGGHKERRAEGVRLVMRAASAGDTRAQLTVGSLYDSGSLLTKSPAKAADWYIRAFSSVDRSSVELEAGYRYLLLWLRRLIPEDLGAVRMILSELVRYNHIEGKLLAAQLAFSEKLDIFNSSETFQLASEIATAGYGIGYLLTAACHERGFGTQQNWTKAAELYQRAGDTGLAIGYARLGDIYAMGLGRQPDAALALTAYQRAVELGYKEAEPNLLTVKQRVSASKQ